MKTLSSLQELLKNERFASLLSCVEQVGDPRIDRMKKHPYASIIVMALSAFIGGANTFSGIALFAKDREELFNQMLQLPYGIPSHDTFNRVLSRTNPKRMDEWMLLWLSLNEKQHDKYVHLDGKMHEAIKSSNHLNIVHAWGAQTKSVLAQTRVVRGSNEITAVPTVLNNLSLDNKIVTTDALNTQKNIARLIVQKGGDYILPLKRNQHQFYADVKLFLDDIKEGVFPHIKAGYCETRDTLHGRMEVRRCWVTDRINWLSNRREWAKLSGLVVIESERHIRGEIQRSQRYFITSLPPQANLILDCIRSHWSIENCLHWHLDMTFNEDRSTIRDSWGAQNVNLLRVISLSLLMRTACSRSIADRRSFASYDFNFLMKTLLST